MNERRYLVTTDISRRTAVKVEVVGDAGELTLLETERFTDEMAALGSSLCVIVEEQPSRPRLDAMPVPIIDPAPRWPKSKPPLTKGQ